MSRYLINRGSWYRYTILVMLLAVVVAIGLAQLRDYNKAVDLNSLWSMGLGRVQPYSITLIEAWGGMDDGTFYAAALVANGCQLILSFGWYFSNSLLTRIVLAHRWLKFIEKRRTLRVSVPTGNQRSSYFLSLPFRYSLPLLMVSAVAHWLVSRSIFVVHTRGFSYQPGWKEGNGFARAEQFDGAVVGFSVIVMVLSVATLSSLLIVLVALSFRELPSRRPRGGEGIEVVRMPLVGTCSAAISSACHPGDDETDIHLLPLQWGRNEAGKWGFTSRSDLAYDVMAGLRQGSPKQPEDGAPIAQSCHLL
jgi:hypothetical protein